MNLLQEMLDDRRGSVNQLARTFGLDENQVTSALSSLVPELGHGLRRNAGSPEGLESLAAALGSGRHDRYAEEPAVLSEPAAVTEGNGILGHVFGSKDTSREVAARAAAKTGISSEVLKRMLPVIATMVMGHLGRKARGGTGNAGGLGGLLGSLLGGGNQSPGDLLGQLGASLGRS